MNNYFADLFRRVEGLSATSILFQILIATALGLVIYLSYFLSHQGTIYSRKFNASLVILAVLTTVVMTAIGNNVALSLGMVGALSIVRFRTAIKDSRDTVYIFWAVVVGLTCGVRDYITAGIGSAMAFLIFLLLGQIKNENRMLLIIRGAKSTDLRIMSAVSEYFERKVELRVKNTTTDTVELIYELSRRVYNKASRRAQTIEDILYKIEHVEYVNIVAQDDDISS